MCGSLTFFVFYCRVVEFCVFLCVGVCVRVSVYVCGHVCACVCASLCAHNRMNQVRSGGERSGCECICLRGVCMCVCESMWEMQEKRFWYRVWSSSQHPVPNKHTQTPKMLPRVINTDFCFHSQKTTNQWTGCATCCSCEVIQWPGRVGKGHPTLSSPTGHGRLAEDPEAVEEYDERTITH